MNYHVYRNRNKGVPTIVALFIVLIFAAGIGFIATHKPRAPFTAQKTSDVQLERTVIGNVRDNTATIYWRTSEATKGHLLVSSQQSDVSQKVFDQSDTEGVQNLKKDHVVTLGGLEGNTTYYYYINVDGEIVGQSAGTPFQLKTTDSVNSLFDQSPIFGRIFTADRHIISNSVMIVTINGAEPLITVTKGDGTFSLPPCCVKKDSLSEIFTPSEESKVILEVMDETSVKKQMYTYAFLAENNEIYFGQNEESQLALKEDPKQNFLIPAELVETIEAVDIIFPRKNAVIPDTKPLIKGVGEPGKQVKGRVEPDGKLFSVAVEENGQWMHTFGTELSAGPHSLLVETEDEAGKKVALSRSFTILKSGEAVLGESTPSASLTPQVSISPTQSPTTPTAIPTVLISPSPMLTSLPSDVPTKPPPVSGSSILPFASVSIALIMIGMGVLLFY